MNFEERRIASLVMLAATGMPSTSYAPLLVRILWYLRFKVPPPHFASFLGVFAVAATVFGLTWGLLMWLVLWSDRDMPIQRALVQTAFAGLIFGLLLAVYYHYGARRHGLPKWEDISNSTGARPSS